ncbi:MAG: hypothetical protein ACM3ZU_06645 [Bacteroidota bacterium]
MNVTRTFEKKQELREIKRKEILRTVRGVLATYCEHQASGWITADVRSGKAIWVGPVVADVDAPGASPDEESVFRNLDDALREFQRRGVCSTVTLVAVGGREWRL